ncbi:MAG: hypothetical protein IPI65_05670 [Bacteroidetes bacterium]|nr:hypothetical protein [Bacteroidota bacterium]
MVIIEFKRGDLLKSFEDNLSIKGISLDAESIEQCLIRITQILGMEDVSFIIRPEPSIYDKGVIPIRFTRRSRFSDNAFFEDLKKLSDFINNQGNS